MFFVLWHKTPFVPFYIKNKTFDLLIHCDEWREVKVKSEGGFEWGGEVVSGQSRLDYFAWQRLKQLMDVGSAEVSGATCSQLSLLAALKRINSDEITSHVELKPVRFFRNRILTQFLSSFKPKWMTFFDSACAMWHRHSHELFSENDHHILSSPYAETDAGTCRSIGDRLRPLYLSSQSWLNNQWDF